MSLAEKKITDREQEGDKREFDSAWQEMLNHATIKVYICQNEKIVWTCSIADLAAAADVNLIRQGRGTWESGKHPSQPWHHWH